MAATVQQGGQISGLQLLILNCDDAYPTGGYDLPTGPNNIVLQAGHSPGYLGVWDADARKLKVVDSLTGQTEVSAGTDLTGVTIRVLTA